MERKGRELSEIESKKKKRKDKRMKTLKFFAETGLCVGTGALIGAANYFYDFSMKPVKHNSENDDKEDERLYTEGRIWMNTHPAREAWFEMSDDSLRIHANFIPSPVEDGDHRYAICVHGYSDTSESVGQYARVYRDRYGMNVLLPDLRGHGRSEGTYVGYGYHDRLDMIIWIDRIIRRDPQASIILHGISMGAATVMMTTGEPLPSNVKACVEDAGYSTAIEEFTQVYNNLADRPPVSADVIMPALRAVALFRAGYDLSKASPIDAVRRSKTPTLFIHGAADSFIPSWMMDKLFEAASCEKMSMLVPGAEHVKSVVVDPEGYWKKVDRFLAQVDPALIEKRAKAEEK